MGSEHPNATAYRRTADAFRNDEHVCALSIMGARRDTVEVEARVGSLFRYRDGQQLERWFYVDDLEAWDQIFDG